MYDLYKTLDNGIKIYLTNNNNNYDIQLIINNFGSERDFDYNINGIFHFFEHFIIKSKLGIFVNGYTARNYMSFVLKRLNTSELDYFESVKFLINWFYDENNNPNILNEYFYKDFKTRLSCLRSELENEYYFRKSYELSKDPFYFLEKGPVYMGGRNLDFKNTNKIKETIIDIWKNIDPKNIYFFIPFPDLKTIELINLTFGKLIPISLDSNHINKLNSNLSSNRFLKLPIPKMENSYIHFKCSNTHCVFFLFKDILYKRDLFINLINALYLIRSCLNVLPYIEYVNNDLLVKFFLYDLVDLNKFILFIYNYDDDLDILKLFKDGGLYNFDYVNTNIQDEEIIMYYSLSNRIGYNINDFLVKFKSNNLDFILKKNKEILINLFKSFKDIINHYGYFFINTPYNVLLNNSNDKHGEKFLMLESKINFNKFTYKYNLLYNNDISKNIFKNYFTINNNYLFYNKRRVSKVDIYLNNIKSYAYILYLHNDLNNENIQIKNNKVSFYFNENINKDIIKKNFNILRNKFCSGERNITVGLYLDLFKFYFLDPYCPNILEIIWCLTEEKYLQFPTTKRKIYNNIYPIISDNIYNIKTNFNFFAISFLFQEDILQNLCYLDLMIKTLGLTYSLYYDYNIYKRKNNNIFQYYLFSVCVDPVKCSNFIISYIKSYYNVNISCIISKENNIINLSELVNIKKNYYYL